MLLLHDTDQQ